MFDAAMKVRISAILIFSVLLFSLKRIYGQENQAPFLVILGTAQDGGYPHVGCDKECCRNFYERKEMKHYVSCIAIVDPVSQERFLFDCTPDFPAQLHLLDSIFPSKNLMDGIFLTHAHIGHHTGLMYLGREAMNTSAIRVFAMPDMKQFLENNGPWSLLVQLKNIEMMRLVADSTIHLNERISVTPFLVPHRHEFTQAVGYKISMAQKSVIFIPDIDKWSSWSRDIVQLVKENDFLFLDGTFFHNGEIPGRDMSEIPHPFIEETMKLFESLPESEKSKIYFIHLNHTNPALLTNRDAQHEIEQKGFHIAKEGEVIKL